jgi:hypothetical protein
MEKTFIVLTNFKEIVYKQIPTLGVILFGHNSRSDLFRIPRKGHSDENHSDISIIRTCFVRRYAVRR